MHHDSFYKAVHLQWQKQWEPCWHFSKVQICSTIKIDLHLPFWKVVDKIYYQSNRSILSASFQRDNKLFWIKEFSPAQPYDFNGQIKGVGSFSSTSCKKTNLIKMSMKSWQATLQQENSPASRMSEHRGSPSRNHWWMARCPLH